MWFIVSVIIKHRHIRTDLITLNKPDCTQNVQYGVSVWSLFLVFNTILFFLIITTIHIYYQHNVSHNIADFSVPMGYIIFHLLIYLNDPLCITASYPAKCWTRHQKDYLQKAEKNECQPTLQHAINPSIQNNLVRFWNVYFSEIMWIALETLPDPLTPGGSPPSSKPSPGKKQSHNEDGCQ